MTCKFEKDYVVYLNKDVTQEDIDQWTEMVMELKRKEERKETKRLAREECKRGWKK